VQPYKDMTDPEVYLFVHQRMQQGVSYNAAWNKIITALGDRYEQSAPVEYRLPTLQWFWSLLPPDGVVSRHRGTLAVRHHRDALRVLVRRASDDLFARSRRRSRCGHTLSSDRERAVPSCSTRGGPQHSPCWRWPSAPRRSEAPTEERSA